MHNYLLLLTYMEGPKVMRMIFFFCAAQKDQERRVVVVVDGGGTEVCSLIFLS